MARPYIGPARDVRQYEHIDAHVVALAEARGVKIADMYRLIVEEWIRDNAPIKVQRLSRMRRIPSVAR